MPMSQKISFFRWQTSAISRAYWPRFFWFRTRFKKKRTRRRASYSISAIHIWHPFEYFCEARLGLQRNRPIVSCLELTWAGILPRQASSAHRLFPFRLGARTTLQSAFVVCSAGVDSHGLGQGAICDVRPRYIVAHVQTAKSPCLPEPSD